MGKVLGETYEIVRLVGEGGMGRVYEARHLRLKERRFAIKVLHAEFARDAEVVVRFQNEAEAASAIGHPNVLDVFDVHKTQDGRPYLVGEFLEGEELGDYLRKAGKLDVPVAVTITRQVCRALSAAHARGIVHRDMKPENVFLRSGDGAPFIKVLDFGISKVGNRNTALTRTGMVMGTPSYMAPEQARGDKVDFRVDIYAVGALLYQMLTGQRPFDSDDAASTLTLVLTQEPVRPRALDEHIPEALELVIQRAMAKDPRDRYQSMADLDQALAPFDVLAGMRPPLRTLTHKGETTVVGEAKAVGGGFDVTARTMMASAGALLGEPDEAQEARLARPLIVVLSVGLGVWLIGGFVDALGGLVRYFHEGDLTFTESLLLLLGTGFAAATPAVLYLLRVRNAVWPNSVKASELAADLKRTMAVALGLYGLTALLTRIFLTVLMRHSGGLASGLHDAALFVVSVVAAVIAGGVGPVMRFFRRKANE